MIPMSKAIIKTPRTNPAPVPLFEVFSAPTINDNGATFAQLPFNYAIIDAIHRTYTPLTDVEFQQCKDSSRNHIHLE